MRFALHVSVGQLVQKTLGTNEWKRAPHRDEIEVALFGPGFGECSLVHVGGGRWIIIDSCLDAATRAPAAISYLSSMGYHLADCVELIIATHWHDDHVRGMGEVVRLCPNAKFCCSSAFRRDEFHSMLEAMNEGPSTLRGAGLREIYSVCRILETRGQAISLAAPNKTILRLDGSKTAHGLPAIVTTLSPSDRRVSDFFREIGTLIVGHQRIEPPGHNHLTVVTLIEIGAFAVLLGGDLEETANPQTGWVAIVSSEERPQTKASVFKIPHHGSANGHNDSVWSELLLPKPFAAITPFNRGTKLPTLGDVARIVSKTDTAYLTARLENPKSATRRSSPVEHQLRLMDAKLTRAEPRTGAVRFRGAPAESKEKWVTHLRDDAHLLTV